MGNAQAFIDSYNGIAQDWASSQSSVPQALLTPGLVYRHTWPSIEALETLRALQYDPQAVWNGWLDSSLDLRDGLSVVEVFAPAAAQPAAEGFLLML